VFIRALHGSLNPVHTIRRSTFISSIHLRLGLDNGLFPSGFRTNILYAALFFVIRATFLGNPIALGLELPTEDRAILFPNISRSYMHANSSINAALESYTTAHTY
jgi:hypothetical protein